MRLLLPGTFVMLAGTPSRSAAFSPNRVGTIFALVDSGTQCSVYAALGKALRDNDSFMATHRGLLSLRHNGCSAIAMMMHLVISEMNGRKDHPMSHALGCHCGSIVYLIVCMLSVSFVYVVRLSIAVCI